MRCFGVSQKVILARYFTMGKPRWGKKMRNLQNDLTESTFVMTATLFVMGVPAGNVIKLGNSFFRAIGSVNILTTDFNPLNQERKLIESRRLDTFYCGVPAGFLQPALHASINFRKTRMPEILRHLCVHIS